MAVQALVLSKMSARGEKILFTVQHTCRLPQHRSEPRFR